MKTTPKVRAHKTPTPSVADPLALAAGRKPEPKAAKGKSGKANERRLHSLELIRQAQAAAAQKKPRPTLPDEDFPIARDTVAALRAPYAPPTPPAPEPDMSLCAAPVPGLFFSDNHAFNGALVVERVLENGRRVVAVNDTGERCTLIWENVSAEETPAEHGIFKRLAPLVHAAMIRMDAGDDINPIDLLRADFLREKLREAVRAGPDASDDDLAMMLKHHTENAADLQELLNRRETVREAVRKFVPPATMEAAAGRDKLPFEQAIIRDIRAMAANRPAARALLEPIGDPFMSARNAIRAAVASVEKAVEAANIDDGDDDLREVREGWGQVSAALINLSDESAHRILNRGRIGGGE